MVNGPIPEATNPVRGDAPTYHLADGQESMFVGDALWACSVFESASEAPQDLAPNIVIDSGASATVCSIAISNLDSPTSAKNYRQVRRRSNSETVEDLAAWVN